MYTDAENHLIELIHAKKDKILSETNHWEGSGTADQLAYRQSLRDIEDQPDFPFNITWPIKPE